MMEQQKRDPWEFEWKRKMLREEKEELVRKAKDTISAASRLLRRKVPQTGHLMTSKKFWMQTVPSQDVDVAVTFPPDTGEATVLWFRSKMEKVPGLTVQTKCITLSCKGKTKKNCFAFWLSATYQGYLRGLEQMQVPKTLRDDLGGGTKEFTISDGPNFKGIEELSLFLNSQERQMIILHLLNSIRAEKGDEVQKLRFREGEAIVPRSLSGRVLYQVFPVHEQAALVKLQKTWVQKVLSRQPIGEICDYFGIKVAFYFSWLGHYTTALFIPAFVGIAVWFFLCGGAEFLEDLGFVLFAFFNVIWATLYLESWKRRSAELAYRWGTADQRDELLTEPRPLFKGEERVSEITGKPELFYPDWKRNLFRYFVSGPIIALCLVVVFLSVFLILELQQWWDVVVFEHGYYEFLKFLPKILLAVVIPILDGVYNNIALWLNDMENFRNATEYENHLVVKKTLFQFVNSFLALFYTAFYLQDMDKLKELLATLLITRQVMGNIKESVIPYAKKQFNHAKLSFDMYGAVSPGANAEAKKIDAVTEAQQQPQQSEGGRNVSQVELESSHVQYEGTFEDYLEMFIQFGYVTLFSCAYPLAALWALLNNIFEIRGDAFKLCFVHQRPFGQRVRNIGTWQTAMEMMGVIACLVNCALIGLSGQVDRMFPNITANQTIILIVVLEHMMLLMKMLIAYAIPDVPAWVATEMAKIEYKRREMEKGSSHFFSTSSAAENSLDTEDRAVQTDACKETSPEKSVVDSAAAATPVIVKMPVKSRDLETEEFMAAISSSASDIFHKVSNPQQVIANNARHSSNSPFRSNSLKCPEISEDPAVSGADLRKRSCPLVDSIPEDRAASAMAAAISDYDQKQLVYIRPTETASNANGSTKRVVPTITLDDVDQLTSARKKEKKMLRSRMASDTDLWFSLRSHQERYNKLATTLTSNKEDDKSPVQEFTSPHGGGKIFINHVEMPQAAAASTSSGKQGSGAPTPVGKRVLEQDEFNKKLKAKRLIFSTGRSLSLASFRLPHVTGLSKKPKLPTIPLEKLGEKLHELTLSTEFEDDEEYLKQNPAKGELDLLNLESLINMADVAKNNSSAKARNLSAGSSGSSGTGRGGRKST